MVSIIIAMRNEATAIASLLQSIKDQTWAVNKFEVILVDDHSTDESVAAASSVQQSLEINNLIILNSPGHGKKEALTYGMAKAKGEIILATDADCIVPPAWIEKMVGAFNPNTQMVIGAVAVKSGASAFSKLQGLEFSSVMGSGLSLASLGWPIMCNGANLGYRKSAFNEVAGYEGNFHIPSGDDEFLMRKILKRYPSGIRLAPINENVVQTDPQPLVRDFLQQRMRWAGKWKANNSLLSRFTALFILVFQASWLVAIVFLFINISSLSIFLLILVKLFLESIFLWQVSTGLNKRFHWLSFLSLQVIYPAYVVVIGVMAQLKNYHWKGRNVSVR